jgi:uncharacterized protein
MGSVQFMHAEPISVTAPHELRREVASQRWEDATFAHWKVAAELVAPLLPHGIRPDEFDGSSWVGLIAFRLAGATVGPSPSIPYFGTFTEVNVRLYGVDPDGRRGVVFLSLEAARFAAVAAARAMFSLPYMWATTGQSFNGGVHSYWSSRIGSPAEFTLSAMPDLATTADTELDHFLTARWALFERMRGRTMHLPNTHEPWQLHPARLLHLNDTLLDAAGFPGLVETPPDSVLFSPGVTARFGSGDEVTQRTAPL